MKTMKFKTNIKCAGCLAKVRPELDGLKDTIKWSVNIADPDRTLTVETESASAEQIVEAVKKAGFSAEEAH